MPQPPTRHLVLVLGDQLDPESAAFDGFDDDRDAVLMAEVEGEARFVPSHKQRVAMFLAAMRHCREEHEGRGRRVRYRTLEETAEAAGDEPATLAGELALALEELAPEKLILLQPGRHGLETALVEVAEEAGVPVEVRPDRHFLCSTEEFDGWAEGRKSLLMETFYRWQRKRLDVLMDGDDPVGDRWNFDKENRESFGKEGPPEAKEPVHHRPDDITREVLTLVAERFPDLPGDLESFDWPVTREEARRDLDDFIEHRLPLFGTYQDAMWTGRPWLFHARLSTALNLKLLDPRDVVRRAEEAYDVGHARLNDVEGFIRQVLGWREFIRGVYYREMPGYMDRNSLDAEADLPEFFWSGDTGMACVAEVVGQLRRHAYAHHIQRLMVTGLFALLWGAEPRQVHDWYMAMYADSVEWVTAPNTLGMSQHADGGVVGTKPYVASGKYVDRMSDYCAGCRYDPARASGEDACPFTTLYWDFLHRHRERFENHPRMALQVRNLDRKDHGEISALRRRAEELRRDPAAI